MMSNDMSAALVNRAAVRTFTIPIQTLTLTLNFDMPEGQCSVCGIGTRVLLPFGQLAACDRCFYEFVANCGPA